MSNICGAGAGLTAEVDPNQLLASFFATVGISEDLVALVALRTAQIRKCDHCVELHAQRFHGSGRALHVEALQNWRNSKFFSLDERAALEVVELLRSEQSALDACHVYDRALERFSDQQVACIALIVSTINAFGLAWKVHFLRRWGTWAAAGLKDTLLRWKFKPEKVDPRWPGQTAPLVATQTAPGRTRELCGV